MKRCVGALGVAAALVLLTPDAANAARLGKRARKQPDIGELRLTGGDLAEALESAAGPVEVVQAVQVPVMHEELFVPVMPVVPVVDVVPVPGTQVVEEVFVPEMGVSIPQVVEIGSAPPTEIAAEARAPVPQAAEEALAPDTAASISQVADAASAPPADTAAEAPVPQTAEETQPAKPDVVPQTAEETQPAKPAVVPQTAEEKQPAKPALVPPTAEEKKLAKPVLAEVQTRVPQVHLAAHPSRRDAIHGSNVAHGNHHTPPHTTHAAARERRERRHHGAARVPHWPARPHALSAQHAQHTPNRAGAARGPHPPSRHREPLRHGEPAAPATAAQGGAFALPPEAPGSTNVRPLDTTPATAEEKRALPREWTKSFGEEALVQSQREADRWAEEVKDAMRHTWAGYKERAWGHDGVTPDSGRPTDWCRLAITMLDGLSTLWVMGLHKEFNEAAEYLTANPLPSRGRHGLESLFEINIRALGGLLSAHSLSGMPVFLDTAKRLGDAMLGAFHTQSGLPQGRIDVGTGEAGSFGSVILSEATSLQVELRYLTHATGLSAYEEVADRAEDAVLNAAGHRGLVPVSLSAWGGARFQGGTVSMGAQGDSYYEYLLKQWIQSGRKEDKFKKQWLLAMQEMMSTMVGKTRGNHAFIGELHYGRRSSRMEHLTCYVGGMLMLGSRTLPAKEVDPRWEHTAAELGKTCYDMSKLTSTGLAPEFTNFNIQAGEGRDMSAGYDSRNLLRPEAIETLYYLHYYTGDPKYRRWAYDMFSAFQRHCKTRYGYSAVSNVDSPWARHLDSEESFWLAETLKYFYLIFAPRSALNLEEYVLNTEAQPLKVWT